jgi:hypothetical protein
LKRIAPLNAQQLPLAFDEPQPGPETIWNHIYAEKK